MGNILTNKQKPIANFNDPVTTPDTVENSAAIVTAVKRNRLFHRSGTMEERYREKTPVPTTRHKLNCVTDNDKVTKIEPVTIKHSVNIRHC